MADNGVEDVRAADESEDDAAEIDGRSARRDRNLDAVMDATIALIADGSNAPTAVQVAARSGVSQRSVNRYFGDVRTLQNAAVIREVGRGMPLFRIHAIGTGSRDHRVRELVEVRVRAHETIGPIARAATSYARTSKFIHGQMAMVRTLQDDQIEKQFATELNAMEPEQRSAMLMALGVLLQFPTLDYYLTERALTVDGAIAYLSAATHQLLAASPVGADD